VITDPRFAPKRTDLPWLRRRRVLRAAAAQPALEPPAASPAQSARAGNPALGAFLSGHATHSAAHPQPTAPTPPPAPAAPPRPVSSSLDLDEPAAPPPAAPPAAPSAPRASPSLDLNEPAVPRPRVVAAPSEPVRRKRTDARVRAGERFIMSPIEPTVTLTKLQSAIGTLTIEAAVSDEVGDLRIGCAYELADDFEQTMQMTQGNRFAPPHSKRPVLVGGHDRFERVQLDLRQCRSLRRLIVYAFSEHRRPLKWGGTLVTTTLGGARIEIPLDVLQAGDIAVLMSIYQVRGEFVLRAEMQTLYGDVREAARAYGYERITWLDSRTPVE
jgi:uncharacterized protein involved in tellurium resistance